MNVKYCYSDVVEVVNSSGCKLLSGEGDYKNARSTIEFLCGKCNEPAKMMFCTFNNGKPQMCAKCRVKNRKFSRITNTRYTQASVEKLYAEYGCEFLGTYSYNDVIYPFKCKCGDYDINSSINLERRLCVRIVLRI